MATHTHQPSHVTAPSRPKRSRARRFAARHRTALLVLVVLAVVVAAMRIWPLGRHDAERRGLLRMGPEERRTLFEETRRNAEAVCAQAGREPALVDRCEEATEFLSLFPECDASCEELVRSHRRRATR